MCEKFWTLPQFWIGQSLDKIDLIGQVMKQGACQHFSLKNGLPAREPHREIGPLRERLAWALPMTGLTGGVGTLSEGVISTRLTLARVGAEALWIKVSFLSDPRTRLRLNFR